MSTKPWDIYAQKLIAVGYGHPLWIPELHMFAGGREIFMGDVGYLRHGQFTPLFNTMKVADDPINRNGVPKGFQSLAESRFNLLIGKYHVGNLFVIKGGMTVDGGTPMITFNPTPGGGGPVRPVAGWKFKCLDGPGAFMVIDSPATADNNHSNLWIRDYMQENMDSWLEFANTRLQLGLEEQDLVFVSGTVKASRWAFGASAGETLCGEEGPYACENVGYEPSEDGGPKFAGQPFPVCHSGAGPAGAPSGVREQCLFIHYYKMKRRPSGTGKRANRAPSPCDAKHGGEPAYLTGDERGFDPVGPLLDYILQNSNASIAIASDDDVTELFNEFPDSKQLLRAIEWLSPAIRVNKHGVGIVDRHLDTLWAWRYARRLVARSRASSRNLVILALLCTMFFVVYMMRFGTA